MGFTSVGVPDIFNLISGASAVQTIWSSTEIVDHNVSGPRILAEKMLPGGTLKPGGVLRLVFRGFATMTAGGGGGISFTWNGVPGFTLGFASNYVGPWYAEEFIGNDNSAGQIQTFQGDFGTNVQRSLGSLSITADSTADITMRLTGTNNAAGDRNQMALVSAQLLNVQGPIG